VVRALARAHYPLFLALLSYLLSVIVVWPFADLPVNDDWVYALDVVNSAHRGSLTFLGVESAWSIPQVFLGSVLNPQTGIHVQLRLLGIGFSALSLVGLYLLLCRVTCNKPVILLLLLALVSFPPFFFNSLTFMGDGLFLLLVILSSLCLERAVNQKSKAALLAGLVLCLLSLLQRQFGIFFVVPIVLVSLWSFRWDKGFSALGIVGSAVLVTAFSLVSIRWKGMTDLPGPSFFLGFNRSYEIMLLQALLVFSGFLVSPLFLARSYPVMQHLSADIGDPRRFRLVRYLFLVGVAGMLVYRFQRDGNTPFVGNLFSAFGIFCENDVLRGARPVNLPLVLRLALCAVGLSYLVPLLLTPLETIRLPDFRGWLRSPPLGTVTVIFAALYGAILVVRPAFFDRYYLPLIPAVCLIAARGFDTARFTKRYLVGILACLLLQAFTITTCIDYFSWSVARWKLAEDAVRRGMSVAELDGGYEWNGWNGKILAAHPARALQTANYFVSFSPLRDCRILATEPWSSLWPPHLRTMYLLEKPRGLTRLGVNRNFTAGT
jgi:hypothetical protein